MASKIHMMRMRILSRFLAFLFLSSLPFQAIQAQKGTDQIYKDIRQLGVLANVLYVAAHPDDENTRLISYLSNHLNANTTYLSMTRGDGGQNLIGPEIRDMLGLIRSHELLEARKIDGGNQLFTRANDFGYSKSPEETFMIWDRDKVLSDVVWAIRTTKPDVIITRFTTDRSRPNHGHHTASAVLAGEAFDLAASPSAYPEQLAYTEVWQTQRLYWNTSQFFYGSREAFEKVDKSRMIAIDIGAYDQISGESNSEIAGRSRSMHKSQGFGAAETRGESLDYIDLTKSATGIVPKTLFEGIDITWNRVPGGKLIEGKVNRLEQEFDFRDPAKSVALLLEIRDDILSLRDSFWKTKKLAEVESLIQQCLGLFMEIRTNQYQVTPGASVPVTVEVINRSPVAVTFNKLSPYGMDSVFIFNESMAYNKGFIRQLVFTVPDEVSTPHWLAKQGTDGMYSVDDQLKRCLPADPPAMKALLEMRIDNHPFLFEVPVIYKVVDPAEGEVTRPIFITPPVSVEVNAEALVFNQGHSRTIPVVLTAIADSVSGKLDLSIDSKGWLLTPTNVDFTFDKSGETRTIYCTITPTVTASRAQLKPVVTVNERRYHHKITIIDYDHLPYMSVVREAAVPLQSMDIKIVNRPIGYIVGAGDEVPAALRQIGFQVDELDPASLTQESLMRYQVIMLGVRAFNTVEELSHKNKLLFDWVSNGGTLIAQYNVNRGLVTENISPYSLTLSRDRITEEHSPVTMLKPDHPAMQYPNLINAADFEGWAQERGLYFPNKWDEHFTPLLEMKDTGDTPVQGGLLVAPYGSGYYVYSGLSWFRHLPAGNPGPYRMLSNLIALGYKNNKS